MSGDSIFYSLLCVYVIYEVFKWFKHKACVRAYNKMSPKEKHNAYQAEACRQHPGRPFFEFEEE